MLGLAIVFSIVPGFLVALRCLEALYLGYLGLGMLRNRAGPLKTGGCDREPWAGCFVRGLGTNL